MPPQTMRQFLKPPEKAPDTLPRTQSTMSLLDYFSTVIQGLADPTGWTEPKAEDFDNPHAYTQALKAHGVGQLIGMATPLAAPLMLKLKGVRQGTSTIAEYQGIHTPPMADSGAPLHDLTGGGTIYPDDVYSPQGARYYGTGSRDDATHFARLHALKDKPDAPVTIYRAVPEDTAAAIERLEKRQAQIMRRGSSDPKEYDANYRELQQLKAKPPSVQDQIQHGDWVTIDRKYAVGHGESALKGKYKILKGQVPAKTLFTNGDSPYEFGLDLSVLPPDKPQTLKAFHGSPHDFPAERLIRLPGGQQAYQLASEALPQGASVVKEFPLGRFRGDKIGTGEGGQAYSYGHYAAQNPAVSETYKEMLAGRPDPKFKPSQSKSVTPWWDEAKALFPDDVQRQDAYHWFNQMENKKAALDYFDSVAKNGKYRYAHADFTRADVERLSDEFFLGPGKMYELNLHTSPESLLDWDKPLSQQPKKVQEALLNHPLLQDVLGHREFTGTSLEPPSGPWKLKPITGEDAYSAVVSELGGRAGHTEGKASQMLAEAGIHGVQYLDQGSRFGQAATYDVGSPRAGFGPYSNYLTKADAERQLAVLKKHGFTDAEIKLNENLSPQTRNYVIFPHFEHLIEIRKKYGISLPLAASLYKWQQSQKGVE